MADSPTSRSVGSNSQSRTSGASLWPLLLALFPLWSCGDGGGGPVGPEEPHELRPCTLPDQRCWEKVPLGGGFYLPVYRSLPLLEGDTAVERAVIVVHGANRNPDAYFATMVGATQRAGAMSKTLVISPHFQTSSDGADADEPVWTSGGWKRGDQSNTTPSDPDGIGSYEAVDKILAILGDPSRYPRLRKVVVTGHSAGGQYAHRFAAGSRVEETLSHLRFRYVVANPSTYLYLGPERAAEGGEGGWPLPDRSQCSTYNNWHYGLEEVNPYIAVQELTEIRSQLTRRDVVYMVGDQDVGSSMLDVSCGAMLQGPNRFIRGVTLFNYLEAFFPQHNSQLFVVPGVAHSSSGIYNSAEGQAVLFGW
jgi:hypothetical protein